MAIGRPGSGIAGALVAAAIGLAAGAAGAAEVRGWDFGEFGRLAIDWGDRVGHRVVSDGDPVVIEFDRPADAGAAEDLADAVERLPALVRAAELSEDGRRLTLVPAMPLTVNDVATERGLVIDIWPADPQAAAGPAAGDGDAAGAPLALRRQGPTGDALPGQIGAAAGEAAPVAESAEGGSADAAGEAPAAAAEAPPPETGDSAPAVDLPDIAVRGGQHTGFARVVFDWPQPVGYRISRDGATVTVRFDRAADADTRRARDHRLDQVLGVRQTSRGGPLVVEIDVAPGTRIRHFAGNLKVVVDVLDAAARVPPIRNATLLPQGEAAPEPPPETLDPARPRDSYALPERPPRPARRPTTAAAPPAAPAADPDETEAAAVELAPAAPEPPPASGDSPPDAAALATIAAADPPDTDPAAETGDPAPDPAAPQGPAVFDPGLPAAAAVFERAGGLWVVFAAPGPFDVNALLAAGEAAFGPGEIAEARGGFAFRFPLPHDRRPQARREGDTWQVSAVADPAPLPRSLAVEAEPDFPLGARLLIPTQAAESLVRLTDPVIGDELIVVPLHDAGTGMARPRRYAQLRLPATAQGVAIVPLADDVEVRIVEPGIEIGAASGLRLSPPGDAARALMETPASEIDRLFDIDGWRGPEDGFNARRQSLQRALVLGPDGDRERARLEFARFLFAHGQATEALAQLEMLLDERSELADRLDFTALRGAAYVLAGQPDAAMEQLGSPALAESAEAALWRAGAAARAGDWSAAADGFRRAGHILYVYPSPLRERFLVWAAETWLNRDDPARAGEDLAWLSDASDGAADEMGAVRFLRGRIAAARGDIRQAEAWLQDAIDSEDSYYRHRAALALVDLQRATERIDPAEEIERLEAIRYDWRGDAMEFGLLARLGDAYWRARRYREALETWRGALADFPEMAGADGMPALVAERLSQLLAGENPEADPVPPLTAVSLYRDFQALIPEDAGRDRLIRHLAERLVDIDLLGEAGDLLEELVTGRLAGIDKARTGARLAAIRLLDDRPADALAALDRSQAPFEDAALADERRLLRARALSERADDEAALALLQGDDSELAEAARLDIAWRSQNWPLAAEVLGERVGAPPPDGEPLDEARAGQVLNLAIALAMSDDRAALDRLEREFGESMAGTPQAETFALVTRPTTGSGPLAGLAAVRRQVAEVDLFEDFLETYRTAGPPRQDAE